MKTEFSKEQDDMLIHLYKTSKQPVKDAMELSIFKNCSINAVYKHARRMSIQKRKPKFKERNPLNEDQIEKLILAYSKEKYPVKYLRNIPEFSNISIYDIYRTAQELNLCRTIYAWKKEEVQIIENHLGNKPIPQIVELLKRKGYRRTEEAIKSFAKRKGYTTKPDVYSLKDVSISLRVSKDKVRRWIKEGLLKAKRKGNQDHYKIKPFHIARFIVEYPYELESGKPDIPWLVALFIEFYGKLKKGRDKNDNKFCEDEESFL